MKSLLLFTVSLLIAAPAMAENWIRVSDLEQGSARGFELKSTCEKGGEVCEQIDGKELGALEVLTREIEDPSQPIWSAKVNVQECLTYAECADTIAAPDFCPADYQAFYGYNESEQLEAYCSKITGYKTTSEKYISENQTKKAEIESARVAAAEKQASEELIAKKLKRIEQGKRTIAILSVRNDAKNLTASDFQAMLADPNLQAIKGLLETGALGTARDMVAAFPVGAGTYFDQADKDALLADLDAYLSAEFAGQP